MVETTKQTRLPAGDPILGVPEGTRGAILRTRAQDLARELGANQAAVDTGEATADFGLQARYFVASILSAGFDGRLDQVGLGMKVLEALEREHPEVQVVLAMDRSLGVSALSLVQTMRTTRRVACSNGPLDKQG